MPDQQNSIRNRLSAFGQNLRKKAKGAIGGGVLSAGIGLVLLTTSLGEALVNRSYDLPFQQRPFIHPTEVVMVYLDDASYTHLNQKYTEPWDRAFHTRLIKRLTAEKAKAVIFDVVFSDALDPIKDQAFAQSMKDNGQVILAADWEIEDPTKIGGVDRPPNPLFNANAADVGSTALFPADDLYVRKYLPALLPTSYSPNPITSEAWTAALLTEAEVTHDTNRVHTPFWLNYYGPTFVIPSVSLYQALDENNTNAPAGYFSNKVVFVGERLQTKWNTARKDEYPNPFSFLPENKFYPGVTIHATAYMNLVRGDWLRRLPFLIERTLIICIGLLFGIGLIFCRPVTATAIALVAIIPITLANYYFFTHHFYWFPWLIPVAAQIPIAVVWSVAFNSVQLYVDKKLVEQSLSLYLSPKLVKKFASDPKLLKPGATKQMLTILFSDIASFTTISEGMDSDDLAHHMNLYFETAVSECIHHTDGTIVKYIGDAIFAFWNAPDPQSDHQFRAAEAALRFSEQPAQYMNRQQLITRIGLHTGVANVGNFGSTVRVDYTALGENINLASRMEGLNKHLGTKVLLTAETQQGIGPRLITRYLGLFRLKGFERSVGVYELLGWVEKEAASSALRQSFGEALQKFQQKDFAAADAAFRRVLEISPGDGPSKFYLQQIEEVRSATLPADWQGEVELKEK